MIKAYRNRELESLLEYCEMMEEYEKGVCIEYINDGYEIESAYHNGEREAYKDLKSKIIKLMED